jgi:hypothetical protein
MRPLFVILLLTGTLSAAQASVNQTAREDLGLLENRFPDLMTLLR